MKSGSLAVYTRTSLEDYGKSHQLTDESCSLGNQRALILDYVSRTDDLKALPTVEYCDDGFTGTNDHRPRFQDMLRDIRGGRVAVVVVKDLSRLGRNYLEVGDYLERVFPAAGVRVVAINDGYDSLNYIGATGGLDVAFRNFIYDSYSKDLSVKVRSAMYIRMEKGDYVSHPPYGYRRSARDKHLLEPDPETAPVVREIFRNILSGMTTAQAAKVLNDRGVPTPLQYKQFRKKPACRDRVLLWSHHTILSILQNYKYTGAAVNHTRESRFLRDKSQRRTAPEEWIIRENAHEALVSREVFEQANALLRHPRKSPHKATGSADSVFFCGHCGRKLQRTYGSDVYYSCRTEKYRSDAACAGLRLSRTELEEVLLPSYRAQLALLGKERVQTAEDPAADAASFVREMARLEKDMDACERKKLELFEAYHDGVLDRGTFLAGKEGLTRQREALRAEYDAAMGRQQAALTARRDAAEALSRREALISASRLPEDALRERMYRDIDRVMVWDKERVEVRWKLRDLFAHSTVNSEVMTHV